MINNFKSKSQLTLHDIFIQYYLETFVTRIPNERI